MKTIFWLILVFVSVLACSRRQAQDYQTADEFAEYFKNASEIEMRALLPLPEIEREELWLTRMLLAAFDSEEKEWSCDPNRVHYTLIPRFTKERECILNNGLVVDVAIYIPMYTGDLSQAEIYTPALEHYEFDGSLRHEQVAYDAGKYGVFTWAFVECRDEALEEVLDQRLEFFRYYKDQGGAVCLPETEVGCRYLIVACRFPKGRSN